MLDRPMPLPAQERAVVGLGTEILLLDLEAFFQVNEGQIGRESRLDAAAGLQAQNAGRVGGEQLDQAVDAQQLAAHQAVKNHGKGSFHADDTEGGELEFLVLVVAGVRGVVRGDAVDGAVMQAADEFRTVGFGAQRRLDLVDRVVALDELFVEQQVVRSGVGADRGLGFAGVADQLDRTGGGDVGKVQARADAFLQDEIAGDDHFLGGFEHAAQPVFVGDEALVDLAFGRDRMVFRVLDDGHVQHLDIFQRLADQVGFHHAVAVVGKGHGAAFDQVGHFHQVFAQLSPGDGGHGKDVDQADLFGAGDDVFGHRAVVVDRLGVGHAGDGSEAAVRCRPGAAFDGFLVFLPRLAQMGMHVDKARGHDQLPGFDGRAAADFFYGLGDLLELAVFDQDIHDAVHGAGRVDQAAVFN